MWIIMRKIIIRVALFSFNNQATNVTNKLEKDWRIYICDRILKIKNSWFY